MGVRARLMLLALGDATAVAWSVHGAPAALRILLAGQERTSSADELVGALAAIVLAVSAGYLAVVLVVAAAARLPGVAGRCGRRLGAAVVPPMLRGLLAGLAGVSVAAAPVAATAATTSPAQPPGPPTAVLTAAGPPDGPLPAPHWPVQHPPPRLHRPGPRAADQSRRHVRVRPGDSLWQIASRSLPGSPPPCRIAREWPRWWAANRAVIGADPNLIQPGQVLTAPTETGSGR